MPNQTASESQLRRLRVVIRGAVQGVGFRPFIYRLAMDLGLRGWVLNSSQGVFLEAEGEEAKLRIFLQRVEREKPAISFIQSLESSFLDPVGFTAFEIRESSGGEKTALVMPDLATCPDCAREIRDPSNRRYRYPFTNCTNCGPRFTIVEALPYDRPHTTMKKFTMCEACAAEYHSPTDRRFHAQPNACPVCGPQLELWDSAGHKLLDGDDALRAAAHEIRRGQIAAVKGLGGFHLLADARQEETVARLRRRKLREEKPFALMYPSYQAIAADCAVDEVESRLLRSPECPIVLLRRKPHARANPDAPVESVAPGNPYLGVMLPYTPLHHLLLDELGFPLVATSGNLSDEPICIDEREASVRLHGIADCFLVHNRPILRHVDDSIVREMAGRELVLRRARGFAPLPVQLAREGPSLLAVGAHQKNTIAISVGRQVFISQHIGDLETAQAFEAFRGVITSFRDLYELKPAMVVCDMHPNYMSTAYARSSGLKMLAVQHHHAHALACMAENQLQPPVLAVTWDGSGYGPDGTIWGGEFLRVTATGFERVARLRTFPLLGGEKAVKEPRRVALALLYEIFGPAVFAMADLAPLGAFTAEELRVLRVMLERRLNSPLTSSMGRLFDAAASLAGLRQVCHYEGQAAMELEFAISVPPTDESYHFGLSSQDGLMVVDWEPLILDILKALKLGAPAGMIAAAFHNTLARAVVAVAQRVGEEKVILSGGCFQNKYLTECVISHISGAGFRPYWHQRIPPNDGGIGLGQIVFASSQQE